jgi:AGZA family xanthine/uracil permease-like MFS transporter
VFSINAVYQDWRASLGVVFVVAVAFLILTVTRARAMITTAVPRTLRFSAAAGIGLFIAMIGFQQAGLVRDHPVTLVTLDRLTAPFTLLALGGLAVILVLLARGVKTAVFWGMGSTAVVSVLCGFVSVDGSWVQLPRGTIPGVEMDLAAALAPDRLADFVSLGIALLFFSIFDAMGTLYAVGTEADLVDDDGNFPSLGRALTVDAAGAVAGAGLGTSPVTCYIESATGVHVGARTGLANVVTASCFLGSLFLMPVLTALVGGFEVEGKFLVNPVTAPALIIVGVFMTRSVARLDWQDLTEAVPAFLTMVVMPFTYNISHGLAAGFVSYAVMKMASGRARDVHWLVYVVAILFALRYLLIPDVHG